MFITKDPGSAFYKLVYFDAQGNRRKVSTKERTKEGAERFLNNFGELMPGLKKKTAPEPITPMSQEVVTEIRKEFKGVPLSTFLKEYSDYLTDTKSKHYVRSVSLSLRTLLQFTGDIPLTGVSIRTAESFVSKIFARTPNAAALYYRTLKAAFSKAEAWEYIPANPFKKIKLPKMVKKLPRFITKDELDLVLFQLPNSTVKDITLFAFMTGMRLGEILNLRWDAINREGKLIKVMNTEAFTTKGKKERIIPMSNKIAEMAERKSKMKTEGEQFFFTHPKGRKYNEEFISKSFKKAVRKAKLHEDIHFHTLRHSFASYLVQNGTSLYVVKELLGHEDIKTTMIYSHLQKENLVEAVNAFNKAG